MVVNPIDAVFLPYSFLSGNGNENKRYFFSKYGQMGVSIRKKLIHVEASRNLIDLFIPFTYGRRKQLLPRIYNCLKRSNIYTLLDLLNNSQEDLMKMEHFRLEDVKQILGILENHFAIDLPKNKF
ncbi:hypothetical protein Leryth_027234 [Lithospermum erythrorhizon]|nr:hypothetical protein Leryth_027234 [Lithospermum erythrorhizon]